MRGQVARMLRRAAASTDPLVPTYRSIAFPRRVYRALKRRWGGVPRRGHSTGKGEAAVRHAGRAEMAAKTERYTRAGLERSREFAAELGAR